MPKAPKKAMVENSRFKFGENWRKFLAVLNNDREKEAEKSLVEMLDATSLYGKRFLDIGSGSGLFSLAARQLGATVRSFDYDDQSVACTAELKLRFFPDDPEWIVSQGSVLDQGFLQGLGYYDVVYSWGVLHHTGSMWQALDNACRMAAPGGRLYIAIYNDQGTISRLWRLVKRLYCSGWLGRSVVLATFVPLNVCAGFLLDAATLRNPLLRYSGYRTLRGMSWWYDLIDWLGGYPFEVASPAQLEKFIASRGFRKIKFKASRGGSGCNEFLFVRIA